MEKSETALLIGVASAIDNRKPTPAMVEAWHMVVGEIDYQAALRGLALHRKRAPGVYLEPGHILKELAAERDRAREVRGPHPAPPPGKRWAADIIDDVEAIDTYSEPTKELS